MEGRDRGLPNLVSRATSWPATRPFVRRALPVIARRAIAEIDAGLPSKRPAPFGHSSTIRARCPCSSAPEFGFPAFYLLALAMLVSVALPWLGHARSDRVAYVDPRGGAGSRPAAGSKPAGGKGGGAAESGNEARTYATECRKKIGARFNRSPKCERGRAWSAASSE